MHGCRRSLIIGCADVGPRACAVDFKRRNARAASAPPTFACAIAPAHTTSAVALPPSCTCAACVAAPARVFGIVQSAATMPAIHCVSQGCSVVAPHCPHVRGGWPPPSRRPPLLASGGGPHASRWCVRSHVCVTRITAVVGALLCPFLRQSRPSASRQRRVRARSTCSWPSRCSCTLHLPQRRHLPIVLQPPRSVLRHSPHAAHACSRRDRPVAG